MKSQYSYIVYLSFLGFLSLVAGNSRIVGGDPSTIEKHPWLVSIQIFGIHSCGGSIIASDIILTAAHCVTELLVNIYQVVPGTTTLSEATLKFEVIESIVHEDYDSDTYDYDIAILKLKDNLTFSEKIMPIALPEDLYQVPDNTPLTASGWGVTEAGSTENSDSLREVEIQAINWNTCRSKLSSIGEFTGRMMCAGVPNGGKDTCQADSGGALELNGTLIGIVSWGEGCGEADYPGVYTRVSYFRSWIWAQTGV